MLFLDPKVAISLILTHSIFAAKAVNNWGLCVGEGRHPSHPMLWSLFFKIYATAAISYVAVTAGYVSWRVWARK